MVGTEGSDSELNECGLRSGASYQLIAIFYIELINDFGGMQQNTFLLLKDHGGATSYSGEFSANDS